MINEPILAAHLLLLLLLSDGNAVNSIDGQCGSPCALICIWFWKQQMNLCVCVNELL